MDLVQIRTKHDWDGPTPEPQWQAWLDAIAPRTHDYTTWMKLVWVAGDPWEPVHRWFVYQMHPEPLVPEMILSDLKGRSPRERGRWDGALKRFIPDPACNVDRLQWELYRETRCWARPFWVVQGTRGGHKKRWTHIESVISQMNGGPEDPPIPGELCYAEPDWRLWRQLLQAQGLGRVVELLAAMAKHPEWLDEEDLAQKSDLELLIAQWIGEQTGEAEGWAGADVSDAEGRETDERLREARALAHS